MKKDEVKFVEDVSRLKKDERLPYWRGAHCSGPLKNIAAQLYEQGKVLLVTKRHGKNDTEFLVVKR